MGEVEGDDVVYVTEMLTPVNDILQRPFKRVRYHLPGPEPMKIMELPDCYRVVRYNSGKTIVKSIDFTSNHGEAKKLKTEYRGKYPEDTVRLEKLEWKKFKSHL